MIRKPKFMNIDRKLTQKEWDLIRAIRIYREIRECDDEILKERLRQEAEDCLLALIPTLKDSIKAERTKRATTLGVQFMTQEEFNSSIEVGDIVVTHEGEDLRCIGRCNDGAPAFEAV